MPFKTELNYFYLYLKLYLENNYGMECIRADSRFTDKPFLDKIINLIDRSDLVIADITGSNPNVMYELGVAHDKNKHVILLTQDKSSEVPTDIRHIEYIPYDLDNHILFLSNLQKAIMGIYIDIYKFLYDKAQKYFNDFKKEVPLAVPKTFEEFCNSLNDTQYDLSQMKEDRFALPFLLPKIIKNSDDMHIMTNIVNFYNEKY
jgi:hypothetical protein